MAPPEGGDRLPRVLTVLLVALGLALDAVAVSVCAALCAPAAPWRRRLRMPLCFALFQAGMPLLGWLGGEALAGPLAAWDHWLAWGLLTLIGGRMLWEAWRREDVCPAGDPYAWRRVLPLALATSIDALAAGLTIAFLDMPVAVSIVTIGAVTGSLCLVATAGAARLGTSGARGAEALGGLALIAIGARILAEHLA